MRPIKFRAWDKEDEVMIDWFWLSSEGDLYETPVTVYNTPHLELERNDDLIAMQYAGKKDKNGVEVYFNDIVEDEYGHRYEVVFEGDCLRCNGVRRIKGGHKPKNRWFGIDLKIIGNRYENPELLEEQNK